MTKFSWQDVSLRLVLVVAGVVAAALFVLKGESEALPALAIGGTLGAFFISRFDTGNDLGEQ